MEGRGYHGVTRLVFGKPEFLGVFALERPTQTSRGYGNRTENVGA